MCYSIHTYIHTLLGKYLNTIAIGTEVVTHTFMASVYELLSLAGSTGKSHWPTVALGRVKSDLSIHVLAILLTMRTNIQGRVRCTIELLLRTYVRTYVYGNSPPYSNYLFIIAHWSSDNYFIQIIDYFNIYNLFVVNIKHFIYHALKNTINESLVIVYTLM